jgi:hypothetical protein
MVLQKAIIIRLKILNAEPMDIVTVIIGKSELNMNLNVLKIFSFQVA